MTNPEVSDSPIATSHVMLMMMLVMVMVCLFCGPVVCEAGLQGGSKGTTAEEAGAGQASRRCR